MTLTHTHTRTHIHTHLKHSQQGLREVVKSASFGNSLVKVEFAAKELHAEQTEDDDEEEEQQQQGRNGLHGVQQRRHQITQRRPVTRNRERRNTNSIQTTTTIF